MERTMGVDARLEAQRRAEEQNREAAKTWDFASYRGRPAAYIHEVLKSDLWSRIENLVNRLHGPQRLHSSCSDSPPPLAP
jgi:hypothetical protein